MQTKGNRGEQPRRKCKHVLLSKADGEKKREKNNLLRTILMPWNI